MLVGAELDLNRLDPMGAWAVFKAFAAETVEGVGPDPDDDMCLFEYGVYDWGDGKGLRFDWSLCRQFTMYADGEYDHMEQLRCDLYFEVTPELEPLQGDGTWSGGDLAGWAAEVEAQAGFGGVRDLTPVESSVHQEHV
jgi:hypothetical protein